MAEPGEGSDEVADQKVDSNQKSEKGDKSEKSAREIAEIRDQEERIDENISQGQPSLRELSERSRKTAQKKDEFHREDEDRVEEIADVARSFSNEIGEMQEEFDKEVHEDTEAVLDEKEQFEEETVSDWEEEVRYDRRTAEGFAGERQWHRPPVGEALDEDFQDAVIDAGFFAVEMFQYNDLFSLKKEVDGSEYKADADAANRRGNISDSRKDHAREIAQSIQNFTSEIEEDIDLDNQWENLQTRKEKYEEVKEEAERAITEWRETKSQSDPVESESMTESVRNLLSTAAEETGGDSRFESEEQQRLHVRAWRAYQAAAIRALQTQHQRMEHSIDTLDTLDEEISSRINMYSSVREGVENLESLDVEGVGENAYEFLREEGYSTIVDIALKASPEDFATEFAGLPYEDDREPRAKVRDNAEEIYQTAKATALDLAERWGLHESTEEIEERSEDDREERVLKQLSGVYMLSEMAESELEDARNPLSRADEYRDRVKDMGEYIQEELEETYNNLNEVEEEELAIPEAEF